jgi:hypothetical protein
MRRVKAFAPAAMVGWRFAILAPMLIYLRYALATFCFAASVGCLALWWRSYTYSDVVYGRTPDRSQFLNSCRGSFETSYRYAPSPAYSWDYSFSYKLKDEPASKKARREQRKSFGRRHRGFYWPHWYPALIFALAGVAALRLGRRFTLRSAIIATTVVAGLLGMAVTL